MTQHDSGHVAYELETEMSTEDDILVQNDPTHCIRLQLIIHLQFLIASPLPSKYERKKIHLRPSPPPLGENRNSELGLGLGLGFSNNWLASISRSTNSIFLGNNHFGRFCDIHLLSCNLCKYNTT